MAAPALEPTPRKPNFARYWLPVIVMVAVIIGFSAQPRLKMPFKFRNSDKVAHLIEYAGLGLLLSRAWWHTLPGARKTTIAIAGIGCGMAMAACDETFQSMVPGREPSEVDFAADTIGVVLAQAFYLGVVQRRWREGRT